MMLAEEAVGLVFCDRNLADGNYLAILAASRSTRRQHSIVLTGRHGNSEDNHEAISSGIFGVTTTPYHPTDVEWMVIQARRYERKRNPEAEDAPRSWGN
jgi:DNA-binding NtrC family response regulator